MYWPKQSNLYINREAAKTRINQTASFDILGGERLRNPRDTLTLDLPRFGGQLRAWDQSIWSDCILPSCLVAFFCSAPGGAILPSRPARWCGRRAQRRSRTAPLGVRPKGLSLTAASTTADWCASGLVARRRSYSIGHR